MRLIDADALKEQIIKQYENKTLPYNGGVIGLITNAPTVEREGWKLVPIEPTDAMINACDEAAHQYDFHQRHKGKFSIPKIYDVQLKYVTQIGQFYYKAMIAAAPKE